MGKMPYWLFASSVHFLVLTCGQWCDQLPLAQPLELVAEVVGDLGGREGRLPEGGGGRGGRGGGGGGRRRRHHGREGVLLPPQHRLVPVPAVVMKDSDILKTQSNT